MQTVHHDRSGDLRRLHARRDRLTRLILQRRPERPVEARLRRMLDALDMAIEDAARAAYRLD
jgi:hypothetical protein